MTTLEEIVRFLDNNKLMIITAESCTAGLQTSMLADVAGCGSVLEGGYVVYSERAKECNLGVNAQTIKEYGLTSEAVAREMAAGALRASSADLAIANTGKAESDDELDGVVCFACALRRQQQVYLVSETLRFLGDRNEVRKAAARHGLLGIPAFYEQLLKQVADAPAP
jgi:nicotinamide-nucleotide amidase